MKIGFFSDSYKPYMSGVVRSIDSFSEEFRDMGHEVHIFAPDYPEVEKRENVYRFKSIPVLTNPGFRLPIPFSPNIVQEVKEMGLDIIHTHSPFLMGWLGKLVSNKLGLPLVFTYHTLYEEYAHYAPVGEELARKLAVKYSRSYCENSDLVIAPSDYVKEVLKGYGIETPIRTVSTGIKLEPYQQRTGEHIRRRYGIADNEKLLLFVGRLGEEKNVRFLLEAFNVIAERRGNIKLIMVGKGPDRDQLEDLRNRMGLNNWAIFAGWKPPEEVVDFYLAADLFVFPSRTETQGLVTIEAMAGGLPVVAVDAAGSREMIDHEHNGLLVPEGEQVFADTVISLLEDEELYGNMSRSARKKSQEYSMRHMAEKMLDVYERLLSGKLSEERQLA